MPLPRIKIAKDKAELVQKLLDTKGTTGAFKTYADIIAFAASVGAKHRKRIKLTEVSQSEPAPISLEIFISRGYDRLIKLIAVNHTQDIKILSTEDEDIELQRIKIFEEYTNGGLEKLGNELRGAVDYIPLYFNNKQQQQKAIFFLLSKVTITQIYYSIMSIMLYG